MAKRHNISISFTPQQASFLADCVESGRYQTASEAVREGIRLLQDYQARFQAEIERVKFLVREGSEQIDRGKMVDGETFFAEWDRETDAYLA